MALDGTAFLVVCVLVTVGAFVAAVMVMPRLARNRVAPIALRSLILIVVNALAVMTAGVALNDNYQFYADWTDLSTSLYGGTISTSSHAGGTAAQAAQAAIGNSPTPAAGLLPSLPPGATGRDRVLRYTVSGSASGLTASVLVTLPEGYTLPANARRRYPVLETFPGYPGDPAEWIDSMDLGGALDAAVAARTAGPVITISPMTEFPAGVDTECVDGGTNGPSVETWLTKDVPAWAQRTLRVGLGRSSWATIGLSAGAWCAAMATMLHPEQYAAAIVMGGYFAPEFSASYRPFTSRSAAGRRYDLVTLAGHPPPVALWVETSHSDHISYPSTFRLLKAAKPPLAIDALVLSHAGHRMSLWAAELPQALAWLGKNISGFGPA